MSRFIAPHDRLDTQDVGDGTVRLLAPLHYESDLLGGRVVRIPTGFLSDLESVPRWLPLAYALFARTANRAGVVHDRLYQLHQIEDVIVPRRLADAVYYEANALDAYGNPGRWIKWLGLRIGGRGSYASGPARFRRHGNDLRRRARRPLTVEERRRLESLARQRAADCGKSTGRDPSPPPEAPPQAP